MDELRSYVGRIVRREKAPGDDRDPKHDHVLIDAITSDMQCMVRILGTGEVVTLPASELDYARECEFSDRFPSAPVVHGYDVQRKFPKETVIDFRPSKRGRPKTTGGVATVTSSCRVVGLLTEDGLGSTCLPYKLVVNTEHDDDVVEFVNVNFNWPVGAENYQVTCLRGIVIFRNCVFAGLHHGLMVGNDRAKVTVSLESCSFLRLGTCGIIARSGTIFLINCSLVGCQIALCVQANAQVLAVHCKWGENVYSIIATNGGQMTAEYCDFAETACAHVVARSGAKLSMLTCSVRKGGGIVIEGGKSRTTCFLQNCDIAPHENCAGIKIGKGKVDVELDKVSVSACTFGVLVDIGAIGSVIISNLNRLPDCKLGYVNASGAKCWVRVHGVLQPNQDQAERIPIFYRYINQYDFPIAMGETVTPYECRMLKNAGTNLNRCGNCELVEGKNERLSRCGRCKLECYCSRECQKEKWAKHRNSCSAFVARGEVIRLDGYIACFSCRRIELRDSLNAYESFQTCTFCWKVFYCGDACYMSRGADHARVCEQAHLRPKNPPRSVRALSKIAYTK